MRVETINYEVEWKNFKRGSSIFIPCLNPVKATRQLRETTDSLQFKVLIREVIVDGIRGLRVWRI